MNEDGNVVWVIGVLLNKTEKERLQDQSKKKQERKTTTTNKERRKTRTGECVMDIIQST